MCKYNNTTGAEENQVCVKIDIFPLFVFAFIVNIIALIAVLKARSKESWCNAAKPIHVLILCLSTSDTLTVGFQCFMPISSFINCGWAGGQASCGFFGFITAVLMVWSAWIVVFLSFQRFLVTSYPFRYRYHFTTKKIIRALVATFVAECAYFAPPFFGIGQFVYYDTGQFCSLSLTPTGETDTVYLGTLVAQGFVCVLLTVIFNLSVVLRLRARWMTFPGFKSRGNEHSTATFVSLTKAVALLFCLCYIPLLVSESISFTLLWYNRYYLLVYYTLWSCVSVFICGSNHAV